MPLLSARLLGPRVRTAAERLAAAGPLVRVARARMGTDAMVLAYHNVVPRGERAAGDLALHLPQEVFAAHLDRLTRTHQVVPLDRVLLPPPPGSRRPRAAITFDDGYRGALTAGVAELAARGLPATIFVVPSLVAGNGFWWDALAPAPAGALPPDFREQALYAARGRDGAVRALARRRGLADRPLPPHARPASLAELRKAAGIPGITFGSHTWSHPNLARLEGKALRRELRAPLEWLREHLPGAWTPWLSYPYGLFSSGVMGEARAAGYAGAVRVVGGWIRGAVDPMAVPRVPMPAGLTPHGFTLRAAGLLCG
jgi:peptidoglycan/xylan/chitin deacetylase (PgdA/CDA1 family)